MFLSLVATLVSAACPVPTVPGRAIDCYTLTVPENRHAATSSKTVSIPIVRFRAHHPKTAGLPIVFLVGGPGGSSIEAKLDGGPNPIIDDHDLIFFQQRGTRMTTPELDCPNDAAAVEQILRSDLWGPQRWGVRAKAASDCYKRLVAAGHDLAGYDTDAIVADLLDMQQAMKLPKLDLYAMSYGTRVALEAMRRAPSSFHAVVLDSVLPPDLRYDEFSVDNVVAALDRIFDDCALDPECKRAYPDLRVRWRAALDKANKSPIAATIPTTPPVAIRATSRHFIEAVGSAMTSRQQLPRIPKLVDAIARGDLAPAMKILADNSGPSSLMRGQRLTVWCREEAGITNFSRATKHPEFLDWETMSTPPGVCDAWPVTRANLDTRPVTSDVPTIVIAGQYDPATPPAWGKHVLATLREGYFVEMPGRTHVALSDCAVSVMLGFYRDPTHLPDVSCVARTPPLVFEH